MLKKLYIVLCLILSSLNITAACADNAMSTEALHSALAMLDSNTDTVNLIGYQSIDQSEPDEYGLMKYIILDFRADQKLLRQEELASTVGDICSQIISNRPLLHNLSAMGYDMVSVAFDENSQFDCL